MSSGDAAIRVLVVDDHQLVLRGLEWLINAERPAMGVVGTATSVEEACRLCDELRPDVVLLDLDLGKENGAAAIPRLTANGHTRVLILTGVRDEEVRQAAMIAGARGVVPKEGSTELIVRAIEKVHSGEIWLDRRSMRSLVWSLSEAEDATATDAAVEDPVVSRLTARERDIVALLSAHPGSPGKRIATMLGISEHTLRNHLSSIYEKLGVSGRLGLYEFAQRHRLLR